MSDEYEELPVYHVGGIAPAEEGEAVDELDPPELDPEATSIFEEAAESDAEPEEPPFEADADDPFAGWPQPESQTIVEDPPEEGVSVEHVSGEIDVPDGYTVLEGTPTGHRRAVALVVSRFNGSLTNRTNAR